MSRTGYAAVKRIIDIVGATTLLLVMWPVIVAGACLVLVSLGRPVIFRQIRPGRNGKLFTLLKLRTMKASSTANGVELPDAERLGRVGSWLRRLSIDELPQLFNVLAGDMSLVGPRPLLPEYLDRYSAEQARRHEVQPGMTGWAQINGRNAVSWAEKLAMDVWYVKNQSLLLDLQIMLSTCSRVALRTGVSQPNHATVEPFRGNDL